MKKLALLLTLSAFGALAAGKTITINTKNFPDKNFRALVDGVDYDSNENGKLTPAEIKKIDWVEATSCEIKDLTGIKYFPYLKGITAGDNSLKKLDVSKNTKLTKLVCCYNKLTKITLGKQNYLNYLDCTNNKDLKKLDIGKCKKLLKLVKKGKKTVKNGVVQWKIGSDENKNCLRIPKTCKLLNGKKVLYKGK